MNPLSQHQRSGILFTTPGMEKIISPGLGPNLYNNELWGIITLVSIRFQHHIKPEHLAVLISIGTLWVERS